MAIFVVLSLILQSFRPGTRESFLVTRHETCVFVCALFVGPQGLGWLSGEEFAKMQDGPG